VRNYVGHLNTKYAIPALFLVSGSNQFIVCGSEDGHVYVWDLASRRVLFVLDLDDDYGTNENHSCTGENDKSKMWTDINGKPSDTNGKPSDSNGKNSILAIDVCGKTGQIVCSTTNENALVYLYTADSK
jgi:hypothetical protein